MLVTQPPSFVSQSAITSVYVCLWTHMDGRSGHARGQLNELCSCKNIGADAVTQLYQLGDRWGKGGGRSHKLHPMFLESHACLSSAVNKHHGGEGGRKRGSQEGAATASLTPPRLSPAKWEKEEQLEGGSRVWEEIPLTSSAWYLTPRGWGPRWVHINITESMYAHTGATMSTY